MTGECWSLMAVFILGLTALGIFAFKMKNGFGPFNTSTLLLILALSLVSIAYVNGSVNGEKLLNVAFAVIGFAGGLFAKSQTTNQG